MPTLIDLSTEQLTPELLAGLGKITGETEANLQGAVGAVIPALLCAISNGASTAEGTEQLLAGMAEADALDSAASTLESGTGVRELLQAGTGLANRLLGGSTAAIAQAVSTATGVSGSSASNLLAVLAPLVLTTVSRELGDEDRAGSLAKLLAEQTESIQQALPPELKSVVPCGAPAAAIAPPPAAITPVAAAPVVAAASAAPVAPPPARRFEPTLPAEEPPKRSAWRWLLPLLLLLALAALAWYFFRPQPVIAPADAPADLTPTTEAATEGATETSADEATTEATSEAPAEATTETDDSAPAAAITDTEEVTAAVEITATVEATATVESESAAEPTAEATTEATTEATDEATTEASGEEATVEATEAVTPTRAATPTAAVTPTTVATTESETPAASATIGGENAAVCTAIADAQTVLDEGPTITPQTSLDSLQAYVDDISTATNGVTEAAGESEDIDVSGVNEAFDTLDGLVNSLSGSTVGNAATTVNPALDAVSTAYAELETATCE